MLFFDAYIFISSFALLQLFVIKSYTCLFNDPGPWGVQLSDKRRVAIHDMNGTTMVEIGDFYINDGNMLPERGDDLHIINNHSLLPQ